MQNRSINPFILQAVLVGLEAQRQRNEEQIAKVKALLGGRSRKTARRTAAPAGKKRGMSAAGRKRIAAAQQKRWAEWRKKQAAAQ